MNSHILQGKNILLPLLLIVLCFVACDDDIDQPPANVPSEIMTIEQVRNLYDGQNIRFEEAASIYATITMDESTGNIYRQAFIQDSTGAINIRLDFASNLSIGDSVRVALKGATLNAFNNMLQLDSLVYGEHLIKLGGGTHIEPELVTISDILGGSKQARLIKMDEVQFTLSDLGKTFADPVNQFSENRMLQDCDNNQIIVRTSGFADFAGELVPEGNGSLLGIVSQFGNVWQLLIRHPDELDMHGERCETDEPQGSGTFDDPYNVSHAIAFNSGTGVWVEGYIIGVMETHVDPFQPSYEPPFVTNSNIIIADNPDETSLSNSLIVQLIPGEIRNVLNLVSNPEKRGKHVKLLGDLSAYFGQSGMRNTSGYWMDGDGIIPTISFWEANFSNESDGISPFTDINLVGEQNWRWGNFDGGCVLISGHVTGSNLPNENWLVSPEIDLNDRLQVTLEIREAINYITSYNDMQVLVSSDFNGDDPTTSGNWVLIEGFNRPQGNNWTFVDSGSIDLSQFEGESIHIAFRYMSSTSGAATWEISSVKLFEGQ